MEAKITSRAQAFEILGIRERRITREQLNKAYWEAIKQYHPDKAAHLGPDIRELAARRTLEINLAYDYLQSNSSNPHSEAQPTNGKAAEEKRQAEGQQRPEDVRAEAPAKAWREKRAKAATADPCPYCGGRLRHKPFCPAK